MARRQRWGEHAGSSGASALTPSCATTRGEDEATEGGERRDRWRGDMYVYTGPQGSQPRATYRRAAPRTHPFPHKCDSNRRRRPVTLLLPRRMHDLPRDQPALHCRRHHRTPPQQRQPPADHRRGAGSRRFSFNPFSFLAVLVAVTTALVAPTLAAASSFEASFKCPTGGVKTWVRPRSVVLRANPGCARAAMVLECLVRAACWGLKMRRGVFQFRLSAFFFPLSIFPFSSSLFLFAFF